MKKIVFSMLIVLTSASMLSVRFVTNSVDAQGATPASTLINPGFEQASGQADTDPSTAFGWSAFHGGFKRIVTTAYTGSGSIQISNPDTSALAGAVQRIDFNQTVMKPIFVGGFVKGDNIVASPGSVLGASIYAEIYLQSGRVVYWNSVANTGTFDWRWIGFNTGAVDLVNEPISHMFIIPVLGNASGTAWFDDITVAEITPYQSAITLMFDDSNETDYTVALPTLSQYGFAGSAAIVTDNIGAEGFLTADHVQHLFNGGWDILSHTVTHRELTKLTTSEIIQELRDSKNNLAEYGAQSLVVPFGAYNGEILGIAQQYYTSVRPVEVGDNPQGLFPYTMKVRAVVADTTLADVEGWIREAQQNNRWLVLLFHSINDRGDDVYHTSPVLFKQIIQSVSDSGINVVTYEEGVRMFEMSP